LLSVYGLLQLDGLFLTRHLIQAIGLIMQEIKKQKSKAKKDELEIIYKGPEKFDKEAEERLNRAFDILFDEVLKIRSKKRGED